MHKNTLHSTTGLPLVNHWSTPPSMPLQSTFISPSYQPRAVAKGQQRRLQGPPRQKSGNSRPAVACKYSLPTAATFRPISASQPTRQLKQVFRGHFQKIFQGNAFRANRIQRLGMELGGKQANNAIPSLRASLPLFTSRATTWLPRWST